MQLQPRVYRIITIGALLALSAIIVTGAGVRLAGSGLGCDRWPACNETSFVDVSDAHTAIEQLNRLFTGVIVVAVAAAVLGSLIRAPRRRDLTWLSLGLVVGVFGQAVVGGVVVLTDLHPAAVQQHFLLSMVTIMNATVLVRRAGEPDGVARRVVVREATRRLVWALGGLTSVAVLTGTVVTGAGPHAGDEDARRFGVEIADVARIHGATVMLTIVTALVLAARIRTHRGDRVALWQPLTTWMFVAVLQAAIGYVQYFSGVPELLVAAHIAGATALYVATVQVVLAIRRPVPTPPDDAPLDDAPGDEIARVVATPPRTSVIEE
ncbi:MAG: COX15/CtaA family protein [Ilumatobacteraceae bacterium]